MNKATKKLEELKKQIARVEAFEKIISSAEDSLKYMGNPRVIAEGYYDETEGGRKWHSAEYELDEEGNVIYDEPSEDDYNYERFVALKGAIEEIEKLMLK